MSRLSRNISSLVSSEIARRVFGFFSVAYMARLLGVEGFGQVMIGLTVLSYVVLAGSAGLHVLGTRSVARGDEDLQAGSLLSARLVNTVAAYVFVGAVTLLFVTHEALRDVILITSASAFLHALFLDWYFQGRETMMPNAVARSLGALVYLLVLLILVRSPEDVRLAALAAVIGDLVSSGYLFVRYRRTGKELRFTFRLSDWTNLMRQAVPFGAGSVLGHMSVNLPVLLVGALLGASDAGIFSAASKFVFFLLMVDRILGTVLLPASVRLHERSQEELHTNLQEAMRWIVIVGLPLCIGGMILGADLIALVYGAGFADAGALFPVMVWFVLLTLLHTVYTSAVIASGRDADYRNVMIIGAVVYGVFVTAGTLGGGLFGTASGMVAAEAVTVVFMWRAMRRSLPPIVPQAFGRLVLSAIAMGVCVIALPGLHVLLRVAIGGVTYILATFIFKAVSFGDYRTLAGRLG